MEGGGGFVKLGLGAECALLPLDQAHNSALLAKKNCHIGFGLG
jgi:hypothetical protein